MIVIIVILALAKQGCDTFPETIITRTKQECDAFPISTKHECDTLHIISALAGVDLRACGSALAGVAPSPRGFQDIRS